MEYKTKFENQDEFEKNVSMTKEISDSYLSKEDFVKMINLIDFKCVRSCELELITGIVFDCRDLSKSVLYKRIKID